MQQAGAQPQQSAKEKRNQAAAKLERFAHTPAKGGQASTTQTKTLTGVSATRKSQRLAAEIDQTADTSMLLSEASVLTEEEPSLKEVVCAVNSCKSTMSNKLKYIREEINCLRHDAQKTRERTTAL